MFFLTKTFLLKYRANFFHCVANTVFLSQLFGNSRVDEIALHIWQEKTGSNNKKGPLNLPESFMTFIIIEKWKGHCNICNTDKQTGTMKKIVGTQAGALFLPSYEKKNKK